ncbi:MAG: LysR family transcriptional regulator, partial [Enterococcus sp.]|nr:LysR family transcriptional regulator [Enterococcus sp.]
YVVAQDELVLAGRKEANYWLINECMTPLQEINDHYLRENNLSPAIIRTNSYEMIKNLLNQGVGRTIISKLALSENTPFEVLEMDNHRNFYFLTKEEVVSDLLAEVALFIRTTLQENAPPNR